MQMELYPKPPLPREVVEFDVRIHPYSSQRDETKYKSIA
jgi:hypothetical protein